MHNESPVYEGLIVYDGMMDEELIKLHESYPNISVFSTGTHLGQAQTLDIALNFVQTPYIYVTSDNRKMSKSNVIKEAIEALEAQPQTIQLWASDASEKEGKDEGYVFSPAVWRTEDINKLEGGLTKLVSELAKGTSANTVNDKITAFYKSQGFTALAPKEDSYLKV